jgi:predicted phosphatase
MDCKKPLKRCLKKSINPAKVCYLGNNRVDLANIRVVLGNIRERGYMSNNNVKYFLNLFWCNLS